MDKPLTRQEVEKIVEDAVFKSQYAVSRGYYHEHTGIESPKVDYANLMDAPNTFLVATDTNAASTAPTYVFGSSKGANFNLTITGAFLISKDTTASNINVYNSGATVATIAKGTTTAAMVGAVTLSYQTVAIGSPIQVSSSGAGNCTLFLSYTSP